MSEPDTRILDQREVEEIETREPIAMGWGKRVELSPEERDALCQTVRALQARYDSLKSKIAWHRDGVGPDVPVPQERYDKLIVSRDQLRAQLAAVERERDNAATRMRDLCVEKLQELRRTTKSDIAVDVLDEAVNELQALTLDHLKGK